MLQVPARWRPLICRCGHRRAPHRHYNAATYCVLCGCRRWSPGLMARLRQLRGKAA